MADAIHFYHNITGVRWTSTRSFYLIVAPVEPATDRVSSPREQQRAGDVEWKDCTCVSGRVLTTGVEDHRLEREARDQHCRESVCYRGEACKSNVWPKRKTPNPHWRERVHCRGEACESNVWPETETPNLHCRESPSLGRSLLKATCSRRRRLLTRTVERVHCWGEACESNVWPEMETPDPHCRESVHCWGEAC